MSAIKLILFLTNLIIILISAKGEDTSIVLGNDWKVIEAGWPSTDIEDQLNGKKLDFFYIPGKTMNSWRIKTDHPLIRPYKNATFKLSFKYWSKSKQKSVRSTIVTFNEYFDDLSKEYEQNFEGEWMPRQYSLSYEDLKKFNIETYKNEKSMIAFKDIKLEFMELTTAESYFDSNIQANRNIRINKTLSDFYVNTATDCLISPKGFGQTSKCFDGASFAEDYIVFEVKELKHLDSCFKLEYLTRTPTEFVVKYSFTNDKQKYSLLNIKAEVNENPGNMNIKETQFCLRDLVAIAAEKMTIYFQVKSYNKTNNAKISLRISKIEPKNIDPTKENDWKIDSKNFLSPMLSGKNWIKEWDLDVKPHITTTTEQVTFEFDYDVDIPASAYLSSKWIKYHDNLNKIKPKYIISVADKKMFQIFNLIPKICDQFSQCVSGLEKIIPNPDETKKMIEFDFNALKNSKFIRLVFYIEYFKPTKFKDLIKFSLHLEHFGDPCYSIDKDQSKCVKANIEIGSCSADQHNDPPNVITQCPCKSGFTGDFCQITDFCDAADQCTKYSGCENTETRYRCICGEDQNEKIIWTGTSCKEVESAIDHSGWKIDSSSNALILTAKDNRIIYRFQNINTNNLNVCPKIAYVSNEDNLNLIVTYIETDNKGKDITIKLITISILKEENELNFCLRDFLKSVKEEFSLSMSISNSKNIDDNSFRINKFSASVKRIEKDTIDMIVKDKFDEKTWSIFPYPFLIYDNSKKIFQLKKKFKTGSNIITYLASDWINNNTIQMNNQFFLTINKLKEFVEIRRIIRISDGKTYSNVSIDVKNDDISKIGKTLTIPREIKTAFKVLLEITLSVDKNTERDFDISIDSISVGDPCNPDVDKTKCNNDGVCVPLSPKLYECHSCKNGLDSKYCKYTSCTGQNKDRCANSPLLPKLSRSSPEQYEFTENQCSQNKDGSMHECECFLNENNHDKTKCTKTDFYKEVSLECTSTKCDFVELNGIEWSTGKMPDFKPSSVTTPFYYAKKSNSILSLEFKNTDKLQDFCFNLNYIMKNTSKLLVSYKNNQAIPLISHLSDQFSISKDQKWDTQKICVSYLTNRIEKNFNLSFKSIMVNQMDNIVINFGEDLIDIKSNLKAIEINKEYPYLTFHNEKDNYWNNREQWYQSIGMYNWQLDTTNGKFTFITSNVGTDISYLISNWITKKTQQMNLRFKITQKITNSKIYSIHIIYFDDIMKENNLPTKDENFVNSKKGDTTEVNIVFPKIVTSFKIGFKVQYKEKLPIGDELFELDSINFADPCITEQLVINDCSKFGECKRIINETGIDYDCHCQDDHHGKNCQKYDHCKIGNDAEVGDDYCRSNYFGKCKDLPLIDSFECDCEGVKDTFWDSSTRKCYKYLKCTENKCDSKTEVCRETDTEPECECKEHYERNETTKKCEEKNACKPAQPSNKNPCGKATCLIDPNNPDEHICVCKQGYKLNEDNENTVCDPQFCESSQMKPCEQICENDPKVDLGYKCKCNENYTPVNNRCIIKKDKQCKCTKSNQYCDEDGSCRCAKGYEMKEDECVFDLTCKDGVSNNTIQGKKYCECPDGYKFNSKTLTCDLKPICGKGGVGRVDCENKKSICQLKDQKPFYECECAPGQYKDEKDVCTDFCNDERKSNCINANANCVTQYEWKKMNANNKEYCECWPGFSWGGSTDKCEIDKYSAKISFQIKNQIKIQTKSSEKKIILDEYLRTDLSGIYEDINSTKVLNEKFLSKYKKNLEKSLFDKKVSEFCKKIINDSVENIVKNSISLDKCESINNDEAFDCSFSFAVKSETDLKQNITAKLLNKCHQNINDKKYCFILQEQHTLGSLYSAIFIDDSVNMIILNYDKLKTASITKLKACSENNKLCPIYSSCKDSQKTSLYSCLCYKGFKVIKKDNLNLPGSTEIIETCLEESMCESSCPKIKADKNGKCIQAPTKNNDNSWYIDVVCDCNQGFIKKGNKTDVYCVDPCTGINCENGGTQLRKDGMCQCVCKEKYSGELCHDEYSASNAGWIAGIVVLAVLVVIVAGVAFMFARRSRNNEQGGHGMDDYSTSYRVGSGQASRGQTNPSFNRD